MKAGERFFRYFYSDANLWGSLAGLAGLGLLFAGVIEQGWLAIVVGLYAAAAFAAPRPRASGVKLEEGQSREEIEAGLRRLIDSVRGSVSKPTEAKLDALRDSLIELLPRDGVGNGEGGGLPDQDRFQFRQTIFRYLPETIDAYLKLPRLYRQYHTVRDGKTAEALFAEQIALLAGEVDELGARLYQADAQGLLAQGRFLGDKFGRARDFEAVERGGPG